MFSKHGILEHVTSDHGPKFISIFFHSLRKALDMKLHFTSGYHLDSDEHGFQDPCGSVSMGMVGVGVGQ